MVLRMTYNLTIPEIIALPSSEHYKWWPEYENYEKERGPSLHSYLRLYMIDAEDTSCKLFNNAKNYLLYGVGELKDASFCASSMCKDCDAFRKSFTIVPQTKDRKEERELQLEYALLSLAASVDLVCAVKPHKQFMSWTVREKRVWKLVVAELIIRQFHADAIDN